NYRAMNCDFTVRLDQPEGIALHGGQSQESWRVTLADTGEHTMTGARVLQAAKYLDDDDDSFMVTYGDGVSDVNLGAMLDFHRQHRKTATLTGVRPPTRFGQLHTDGDQVVAFCEKPQVGEGLINGGFFCFERSFLNYLDASPEC